MPEETRKCLLPLGKDTIPAFVIHDTLDTIVPQTEGIKTRNNLRDLRLATERA
jgi:hypothetical protein